VRADGCSLQGLIRVGAVWTGLAAVKSGINISCTGGPRYSVFRLHHGHRLCNSPSPSMSLSFIIQLVLTQHTGWSLQSVTQDKTIRCHTNAQTKTHRYPRGHLYWIPFPAAYTQAQGRTKEKEGQSCLLSLSESTPYLRRL
jgi:hypothetical protein